MLRLTHRCLTRYVLGVTASEFIAESSDSAASDRPPESDTEWQAAAYVQFLRDDQVEDAIYEQLP